MSGSITGPSSRVELESRDGDPADLREDAALFVRAAVEADLSTVGAIYDEQVRTSVATFDLEPPPVGYWRARLVSTEPGDHLLVADQGDDAVVGFAYSSAYRPRPGYRHTRETSVYLADGARGRGVGRLLYDDLLARLRDDGVQTALAVVAQPNPASAALHRACGFVEVGTLREVGRKHDRWVDTTWFQLLL